MFAVPEVMVVAFKKIKHIILISPPSTKRKLINFHANLAYMQVILTQNLP